MMFPVVNTGHRTPMWRIVALFVACVATQVASQDIDTDCEINNDYPPINNSSPSADSLAELIVNVGKEDGRNILNISWKIIVDDSTKYLTATHFIAGHLKILCTYKPPFSELRKETNQFWFNFTVVTMAGPITVEAKNVPLPPWGSKQEVAKTIFVTVPFAKPDTTTQTSMKVRSSTESKKAPLPTKGPRDSVNIEAAVFGGIACLMVLSSCYVIYKNCGSSLAKSLGFKTLPLSPVSPVPVLVVYPAADAAFQQAVVALAEFLQWHGGCSVTIDMWQQGKIGEHGPLRWLAEQKKAADRVLIVYPQTSSLRDSNTASLLEPCAPATAHDLYPLVLNMVASHAKNVHELERFWVVQLCSQLTQRPGNLPSELKACKSFCLTKDLNKLCKSLHTQRQDIKKTSKPIFKPDFEKDAAKLMEAVGKLGGDAEQFKSVVNVV